MHLPELKPSNRSREYYSYSETLRAEVVKSFLFKGITSHRELDATILGLNPDITKGFESMNILHYLGLKKNFKNLFYGFGIDEAIEILKKDNQDFQTIIQLLKV